MMRQLRFYEHNPTVNKAVTLLFKFPPDIKSILARGFCGIAENDFDAHILIQDLKSLGKEKTLALYKSSQKRREYDNDPYLARGMNYLMILNPEDQFFLSAKLLDMMGVVRDYMVLCKRNAYSLQLKVVEKITHICVHFGLDEAEEFVDQVRSEIVRLITQRNRISIQSLLPPNAQEASSQESIANENTGMRIRANMDFA